jgi:hypothetical protein
MSGTGDRKNWLERLGDKIPGYSGYSDRERRRDIDKLHRESLANRLRGLKGPLSELVRELSSSGRLMEVDPLDRAQRKLDRLENRIRFASYGYAGFFDVVKIEQPELESIYRFDLALVEIVDRVEAKIRELIGRTSSPDELKRAVAEVDGALDEVSKTFDDRYNAINTFGQAKPPGQPMFGS